MHSNMRFLALTFALMLAVSWSAFGSAIYLSRTEMIQKAVAIAIIEIDDPIDNTLTEVDPFASKPAKEHYRRQARVRVEKTLKGTVPQEFTLYGNGSFICAQCSLSKGKFLAFLAKDKDLWVGANWQLSLRPIRDIEVEWYVSEEQRFPMTFQKLDEVEKQIQELLAGTQSGASSNGPITNSNPH